MRSLDPATSAPSGQPSPFERQSATVSASRPYVVGRRAARDRAAFMSRAPSRWTARPWRRCLGDDRATCSSGQTRPPPPLCVFSMQRTRRRRHVQVGGRVDRHRVPARGRSARRPVSMGFIDESRSARRARQARSGRCARLPRRATSSPGLGEHAQGDLVRHRRGGDEDRLLLAEQRGSALLERDHGRVFALLLVPDDGLGDGSPHGLSRLCERVGAEVDHALTVPGREATRRCSDRLPSTVKATAETAIAETPATVNASAVPPVAASQPASMPPAGPAPLKAK